MACHNIRGEDGPCDCAGCRDVGGLLSENERLREDLKLRDIDCGCNARVTELRAEVARLREMRVPLPGAPLDREALLDEVRRIVEEQRDHALDNSRRLARYDGEADEARCRALAAQHCDEILKRIEGLK